ncbi:MAG: sodium/proline symporter PutP [Clostridium sp.]|jgi:sodium/proline symporter|nr:sodium/proline symporter PutP [Clostridium sp.]
MDGNTIQIIIAMAVYMLIIIGIGVAYAKRANKSSANYFLGGRSLGPWVAAMSAEASDMSGWLLMGLPGVAYWCGLADAAWTAIGLAAGTYINWLIVSKRLRRYSVVAGNAITVPDFFSNRFHEKKKIILSIASLMILVFFSIYVGSCLVTCGKLFSILFGAKYHVVMLVGAAFVIAYTMLGGFLAESVSDFLQGMIMITALLVVLITGLVHAGGFGAVMDNISAIPGFVDFFHVANPTVDEVTKVQLVTNGAPVFGAAKDYGFLNISTMMAWGLGYFGMPQVLLRFMAIRKGSELKHSRRIATIWCVISMAAAVFIGMMGRAIFPVAADLSTASGAENVFILISRTLFHPLFAGIVMSAILAATISSSDSYLLISASAVSKNIFQGLFYRKASDKQVMWVTRITLVLITLFGVILAWNEESVIFKVVSFAWAGFGATFGPLMLFSLFWKRINQAGAVAGMLAGGGMVFFWKFVIAPIGGAFAIYELLPAFLFSALVIVVVSLLTKQPSEEVRLDFDRAKRVDVE